MRLKLMIITSLSVCSSVSRCPTFSQKGDGLALAPCTASPADAMDVVLAILLCPKHVLAESHVQHVDTKFRAIPDPWRVKPMRNKHVRSCQHVST